MPIAIFFILFFSVAFAIAYQDSGQTRSRTTYDFHPTIYIVGDTQLQAIASAEPWPGDGSAASPYVISGYDISGLGYSSGIYIQDTTLYFIIQDCYVHNAISVGIKLVNVVHATLLRDVCSANPMYGIYLDASTGTSIIGCDCSSNANSGILVSLSGYTRAENNTCSSNGGSGIYCELSENLTIANNTCTSDSSYGIYLYAASNSMISGNTCTNDFNGIYMLSSSRSTLTGNTCTGGNYGIYMRFSDSNTLMGNNCSSSSTGLYAQSSIGNDIQSCSFWSNSGYGVILFTGSMSNRLTNNTFAYNNGALGIFDPTYIQAWDSSGPNSWNSAGTPHGFGNYWYDWTSPDLDSDGIVDSPYVLDGGVNAKDNHPLVSAPAAPIPEFGPFGLLLVLFSSIAFVLSFGRRMKT